MALKDLVTVEDVRARARRRLPRMVFEFVDGGAGDEVTLRANRSAFERWTFRPRMLVDVSERDQRVTVLGEELSLPVIFSPAGLLKLAHREGELGAARAAAAAGTVFTLSTGSSYTIEQVAEAASGPQWFQLYLWSDRSVIEGLVERAKAAGYRALCLTVDVPVVSRRERDIRNGMRIPPRPTAANALDTLRRPDWLLGYLRDRDITFANFTELGLGTSATALGTFTNTKMVNPGQSWEDLDWLRELWSGPLLVKGVLTGDDARQAVDRGADAVVVSNHGGRQLDGAPGALAALPEVVAAVGDRTEVLLDGGVRRGADVVKAVALGARAVMMGRPYVYGLGAGGGTGALRVLQILRQEIDHVLALIGCARVIDLDRTFLN